MLHTKSFSFEFFICFAFFSALEIIDINELMLVNTEDLPCCSPWGRKEWDTTERLNNKYLEQSLAQKALCKNDMSLSNKMKDGPPRHGQGYLLLHLV